MPMGFPRGPWERAKREARAVLVERARVRGMISYSELVSHIRAIAFNGPHDFRLFTLLGEISTEEDEAGRGLLTAIVVHKVGDMEPGTGWFDLARERGCDVRGWGNTDGERLSAEHHQDTWWSERVGNAVHRPEHRYSGDDPRAELLPIR